MPALAVADALRAEGAEVVVHRRRARRARARARRRATSCARCEVQPLPRDAAGGARYGAADGRRRRASARARCCASCGPPPCSARVGTSPGPSGWRRCIARIPLVLMEADSHLGLTNRLLAPLARRVCLAFPIAGRDGRAICVTGRPVPAAGDRPGRGARAVRDRPRRDSACWCSVAPRARGRSTTAAVEAFAGARFHVLHAAGRARPARAARRPGRTTTCAATSLASARRCWPAIWSWPASGGSIFEIAAHGAPGGADPVSVRHRRPSVRKRALHGAAGAAVVIPDDELTGPRLAQEVGRLLGDPSRLARWGTPRRSSPGPTPRRRSRPRCWRRRGEADRDAEPLEGQACGHAQDVNRNRQSPTGRGRRPEWSGRRASLRRHRRRRDERPGAGRPALGASVTGSDRARVQLHPRLREHGIVPVIGHAAENVPDRAPRSSTRPPSRPTTPSGRPPPGSSIAPICWPRSRACAAAWRSPGRTARRPPRRWSSTPYRARALTRRTCSGGAPRHRIERRLGNRRVDRGRGR